jgi:WD40 repeat protein
VTGHGDGISAMGFGANDSTLITVGLDNSLIGLDNTVQMVDLPVLAMNRAANENVESAAFGPAGRSLVTTEFTEVEDRAEGPTTLWDLAGTPRRTGVLSSPAPGGSETVGTEAVFGPDHLLATSGWQAAQMWNVADPAHPAPLGTLSARNSASPMAFSQVGHVFVDGAGDLWDVRDPSHPQQVGHVDPTDSSSVQGQDGGMAFRPDGHVVAVAQSDTVRLWDVTDLARTRVVATVPVTVDAAVAFTPDGRTLAIGETNGTVRLWDVSDVGHPVLRATIPGRASLDDAVLFSPDGGTLLTGSTDGTVRLWDVRDATHPALSAVLTGIQRPLAFDPAGHTIVGIGTDGSLRLRETDAAQAVTRMCGLAPTLSRASWDQYFPGTAYQPPCR